MFSALKSYQFFNVYNFIKQRTREHAFLLSQGQCTGSWEGKQGIDAMQSCNFLSANIDLPYQARHPFSFCLCICKLNEQNRKPNSTIRANTFSNTYQLSITYVSKRALTLRHDSNEEGPIKLLKATSYLQKLVGPFLSPARQNQLGLAAME